MVGMDLQRINRISITALLGIFTLFMICLMVVGYYEGMASNQYNNEFTLWMVFTVIAILVFLYHSIDTLAGSVVNNLGITTPSGLFTGFPYRLNGQGNLLAKEKIIALILVILIALIIPQFSLERLAIFFVIVGSLVIIYIKLNNNKIF